MYPNTIRGLIDFSLRDCGEKNIPAREYCREYKRHFAWIKAGKISEEEFFVWAKQAKAKKHECDAERISLDEFKEWLKNS